jgi:hypothetical protein
MWAKVQRQDADIASLVLEKAQAMGLGSSLETM